MINEVTALTLTYSSSNWVY